MATASNWSLPNNPEIVRSLDTEWESIKQDHPTFNLVKLNGMIERIFDASFGDSEIRQQLFFRISDHYNVDYDTLYQAWLNAW